MRVLRADIDRDLHLTNTGEDRPEGLHLSDILKRRMFERDKKFNPNSPIDAMVLERGFTWEYVLERALSARHERYGYRPAPILEDGVWMSPDWVNPDAADIQHEEWKATKKSTKHDFLTKNWFWLPQAMAYLRVLLRLKVARTLATRFRVWHINGDYSYESKNSDFHILNDYWTYDIEFTTRDLEENWRGLLADAQRWGLLKSKPKFDGLTRGAGTRGQRVGASAGYAPTSPVTEDACQKTTKRSSNLPRKSPDKGTAAKVLTFQNTKTRKPNSRSGS